MAEGGWNGEGGQKGGWVEDCAVLLWWNRGVEAEGVPQSWGRAAVREQGCGALVRDSEVGHAV